MGLEVGAYDIMASEVECSSEGEAFGHADTRNQNGSWAEGCIAATVFAKDVMAPDERTDRVAEEKN